MFCNLSIIRVITNLESTRSLLSEYISRRVQAECFHKRRELALAVFIQVGGGRVSLSSTCC